MGYLVDTSQTLGYDQAKLLFTYIKQHGILQFLHLYKKFKDSQRDEILWGDEIELHLLHVDSNTKLPKVQLNNEYMFDLLHSDEFDLQPEFGGWMLETVPTKPYEFNGDPTALLENLNLRRQVISSLCKEGDVLFAGTAFPLLGVDDYYVPRSRKPFDVSASIKVREEEEEEEKISNFDKSKKLPLGDELICSHPRYHAMRDNSIQRREESMCILMPIYPDEKTCMEKTVEEPYPGFIHMDEILYGTGNACMQVTFGTHNIEEARYLTDQLAVFSSILLPLSAATPILKGKLADTDLRWNVLSQCVDCRNQEERDITSSIYIPKTRYSSISQYISTRPECKEEYNDIGYPYEKDMMKFAEEQAKELGIELDERILKHLGFLFKQDPIITYGDKIYMDDSKNTNHFENIQSTNWNNVRFKPPPSFDSEIGWRVELRTIEAQLTAEESVAFGMFSYWVAAMLMKKGYNFYIPISKLDENVQRAHKRDALFTQKFWFRKSLQKDSPDEWDEFTIDELLHGKAGEFIGLFNLIFEFCKEEYDIDIQAEWKNHKENPSIGINKLTENMKYFEILSKRAKGELPTIAHWTRNFVLKHPKYQRDSIVTPEIVRDLINAMVDISDHKKTYQDFI